MLERVGSDSLDHWASGSCVLGEYTYITDKGFEIISCWDHLVHLKGCCRSRHTCKTIIVRALGEMVHSKMRHCGFNSSEGTTLSLRPLTLSSYANTSATNKAEDLRDKSLKLGRASLPGRS
jgi:hypothetical protein